MQSQIAPTHPAPGKRPRFLIIEDDADVAAITGWLVTRFSGKRSDLVADSFEAINAFYLRSYDCLIVDQNLPGLKGLELLKTLDIAIDRDPVLSDQIRFMHKMPVMLMSANPIRIPKDLVLKYFFIQDVIAKRFLSLGLARNLAS